MPNEMFLMEKLTGAITLMAIFPWRVLMSLRIESVLTTSPTSLAPADVVLKSVTLLKSIFESRSIFSVRPLLACIPAPAPALTARVDLLNAAPAGFQ